MPELGKKYNCYSCHTKFYDLGKPVPLCPKCGADQRDAEETPLYTPTRGRRVVEQPVEDESFSETPEQTTESEDEGFAAADEPEEEADDDEEEEEY